MKRLLAMLVLLAGCEPMGNSEGLEDRVKKLEERQAFEDAVRAGYYGREPLPKVSAEKPAAP